MAATSSPGVSPARHRGARITRRLVVVGLLALLLAGCATWQVPEAVVGELPWRERAVSEDLHGVRLSAAVLSTDESRRLFGVDVNATGVQPVWVEVENGAEDTLWLLRAGTDPDYFSPLEVAWSFHAPLRADRNRTLDAYFDGLAFPNPVPPGETRAGIIFTNPHQRTRVLNVDLLGQGRLFPFTLFLPVPDNGPDDGALRTLARYFEAAVEDIDRMDALREALERLPCCARDARDASAGDPLNIILVGQFDHVAAAMIRRGFRADRRVPDDAQRVFGRQADLVGRLAGQAGVPPHWVRLWIAPFRYRGQPVFVGQTGRPVGGRAATADGEELVVHPNVDEVRNYLVQDLMYSGGLARLGFVWARGAVDGAGPAAPPAGGPYRTDGLRAVMFFVSRPLTLSETEILDWVPALQVREAQAAAGADAATPRNADAPAR